MIGVQKMEKIDKYLGAHLLLDPLKKSSHQFFYSKGGRQIIRMEGKVFI